MLIVLRLVRSQVPLALLRIFAMFYNVLYYVPFVRNKTLVKKRIRVADKTTIGNLAYVRP